MPDAARSDKERQHDRGALHFSRTADDTLRMDLSGSWTSRDEIPSVDEVEQQIQSDSKVRRVAMDCRDLTAWDSGLLTFLIKLKERCDQGEVTLERSGLPRGVERLLALASEVPERKGARREEVREVWLDRLGQATIDTGASAREMLAFIGESLLGLLKFVTGRASYRRSDLVEIIQECGFRALPIVSLISLLVGMILGFVGAIQLKMFGAEIYVADLVGIAMVRLMSPIMTGIIMAGRTGAAFAAQLGTMQVNEEIDALRTLGVPPMEYLVVPRMAALILMMPVLCVYADLMGILGGAIVGIGMGITPAEYWAQTKGAIGLHHFWIGLFLSVVFGALVALSGCLRGMQCGRSAAEVGNAATSAVVTGIVSIIMATAIVTVVCNALGI
jgi:phospholipid/cholesterol/gamma-HCH transport system permease protein